MTGDNARIRTVGLALGLVVLLWTCGACAADPPTAGTPLSASVEPDRSGNIHVPYTLYTHCGIRELNYGGGWYARVGGLLDDGNLNPPRDWDNPYQRGRLAVSGRTAVFTDSAGHRETFTLRAGTRPSLICD